MDESNWTEVRRRKQPETINNNEETTYFVSNIPREARKGEFHKVFSRFGKLTDVYMGQNAGKDGKHYVFIRFKHVEDTKELEEALNGTMIRGKRLEVNLAKHKRKNPNQPQTMEMKRRQPPNHRQPPTYSYRPTLPPKPRDNRTYAEIVKPVNNQPPPPPLPTPAPISLQRDNCTHNWLRKTTLIGEAISIDHLGHLPKLIKPMDMTLEIKYIGGLRVILQFDDSVGAQNFKEDEINWKHCMKRLDWGTDIDTRLERISWIRIVGLPPQLWGDKNFEAITRNFGRMIAPFDDIHHRVDLSCVKIGILTHRKNRINDEIYVAIDAEVIKIGVIEFDENYWFPFYFDLRKDFLEKEFCNNTGKKQEGENIGRNVDMENGKHDDDMEEGEIHPEEEARTHEAEIPATVTETNEDQQT
ncbi:hypothetical protein LXL04_010019 [Taraxacum kok-saghyz]